jgi:hypothetical protein
MILLFLSVMEVIPEEKKKNFCFENQRKNFIIKKIKKYFFKIF